ncbi:MAG: glycosyltransferase [Candidatus Eisenbacteria bacterium]|nr:glycosyltransferase [Candidatus Eisenbacteria bacterium]
MISVIIVNFRTPDDLLRLIESLKAHPPAGRPLEILVVDNASGDDSPARLRAAHPDIRLIESPTNRGFAAGVNLGLAAAAGDHLLILNPDIIVHPGSIDALVDFMVAHPQAGLVAAKLLNPDGTLQPTCRTRYTFRTILLRRTILGRLFPNDRTLREHLMVDYDHVTPRNVDWVAGACLLVRREALEEVGPMDERYFLYFEDVDWCTRMHRRGWGVWYVPDSVMTHGYRRASAGGFNRATQAHAESLLRFWEKWSAILYLARRYRGVLRNAVFVAVDLVAILVAFALAYQFREWLAPVMDKPNFPLSHYQTFLVTTLVAAKAAFGLNGLYREEERGDWVDTLFAAGKALLATSLFLLLTTFILYPPDSRPYSRFIIGTFWLLAMVLVTLERRLLYSLLERARTGRLNVKRVALIGSDPWIDRIARALRSDPTHGFEPIRVTLPPIDRPEALKAMLEDERVSDIVLSTEALPVAPGLARALVEPLQQAGIRVHLSGPLSDLIGRDARVTPLAGFSLLSLDRGGAWVGSRAARRVFESLVAILFLAGQALPALLAAFALPLTGSRGRVDDEGPSWQVEGTMASFVRRLSLDRFPGWWAVLLGRRRLVGGPAGGRGVFAQPDMALTTESGYSLPWSPERDLKTIVRDLLARLITGNDTRNSPPPLLERSPRSALR